MTFKDQDDFLSELLTDAYAEKCLPCFRRFPQSSALLGLSPAEQAESGSLPACTR